MDLAQQRQADDLSRNAFLSRALDLEAHHGAPVAAELDPEEMDRLARGAVLVGVATLFDLGERLTG